MTPAARMDFDRVFNAVVQKLAPKLRELLTRAPVELLDEPAPEMLEELGYEGTPAESELYGLHATIPIGQKATWETPLFPGKIYIFRGPIYRLAKGRTQVLAKQIELTLLHEIAHQFGS
jgi:predicted Zn-dependent protease with MMP-like domain